MKKNTITPKLPTIMKPYCLLGVVDAMLMFAAVSQAAPIVNYTFDGDTGNTAVNSGTAGTGANATITGGSFVTDPVRRHVLSMSGASGSNYGTASFSSTTGSYTFSLWYKGTDTLGFMYDQGATNRMVLSLGSSTQEDPDDGGLTALADAGLGMYDGSSWKNSGAKNTTWTTGEWVHVAWVLENDGLGAGTDSMSVYLNGVAQDVDLGTSGVQTKRAIANIPSLGGTQKLFARFTQSSYLNELTGLIDDYRIYNTALSASEVNAIITEPPSILSLSPEGAGIYPAGNLVAGFNRAIALTGGGTVTITDTDDGSGNQVINLPAPGQVSVSASGFELIIDPAANLEFNTNYEVSISSGAVQDLASTPNAFPGTTAGQWTFTTAAQDLTAPVITLKSPADNAPAVLTKTTVSATFDDDIVIGSGDIVIKDLLDGSTTRTIAVTDTTQVSLAGKVLSIDPTGLLAPGRNYAVQIAAGAVRNFSDVNYAGIPANDDTTWNFTTSRLEINNFANGSDAATGISTSTDYTHLVDIQKDADTAVINEVTFDNTLANYTLTGTTNSYTQSNPNNGADPGSGMRHLLDHFKFGGSSPTLTVSGLNAGTTYKLRLYVSNWNDNSNVTFSFDDTTPATVMAGLPRGAGQTIPSSFDYTYTLAPGDTDLAVTITPDASGTFHWYAFSNEVVSGGNTFADWIGNYPGVGGQNGVDQDPDGDGIDNGVENFFGTVPDAFSQGLVAGTASGNQFTFTHPVNATPASDLTATYRWSTDLVNFFDSGVEHNGSTVTLTPGTPSGGFVTVTAEVTGLSLPKLFVNVRVTQD